MRPELEPLMQTMRTELTAYKQLAAVLEQKLDAMRRRDLQDMQFRLEREQRLLVTMRQAAGQRTVLVRRLARTILPGRTPEEVTARELAQTSSEPQQSRMMGLIGMLREAAEKVQRLNRVVTQTTRKLMGHIDAIFNLIAQGDGESGLYGRAGKKAPTPQRQLVDAIA